MLLLLLLHHWHTRTQGSTESPSLLDSMETGASPCPEHKARMGTLSELLRDLEKYSTIQECEFLQKMMIEVAKAPSLSAAMRDMVNDMAEQLCKLETEEKEQG
jgi:hypothetical protein